MSDIFNHMFENSLGIMKTLTDGQLEHVVKIVTEEYERRKKQPKQESDHLFKLLMGLGKWKKQEDGSYNVVFDDSSREGKKKLFEILRPMNDEKLNTKIKELEEKLAFTKKVMYSIGNIHYYYFHNHSRSQDSPCKCDSCRDIKGMYGL